MRNPNCTALFAGIGKYPASSGLNGLVVGDQPFGSMPRDCNLSRASCFNQFARLTPSRSASDSICSFRAGLIRMWNGGDFPSPRGWLSLIEMCTPIVVRLTSLGVYLSVVTPIDKTAEKGITSTDHGLTTNDRLIIEVAMDNYTALIGRGKPNFTQTRPKFTDTYWIVPCYETTPYGKVSFTRQDRRTFIALFKDSRLIWAGRQRVQGVAHG